jgi:hypothetical protein
MRGALYPFAAKVQPYTNPRARGNRIRSAWISLEAPDADREATRFHRICLSRAIAPGNAENSGGRKAEPNSAMLVVEDRAHRPA